MNFLYARPGRVANLILPFLPFLALVGLYYFFSEIYVPEDEASYRQIVPPMSKIGQSAVKLVLPPVTEGDSSAYRIFEFKLFSTDARTEPTLIKDSLISLGRVLTTIAALFVCTFFGLTMGLFKYLEKLWRAIVTFLDKFNVTMVLVIFIMVFGGDERAKIIFMVVGLVFGVTLDVYHRTKGVPQEQKVSALTLGANSLQVTGMVFFQLLPHLINLFRILLKPILMLLVLAEFMGADSGLGYRVAVFRRGLVMEHIFVYVIWTAFLTFALDYLGQLMLKRFRWFEK